ncbi:MAG: helix-turn-helix transcriptional regulator [Oscillospiraceae bacterium]|nr:helix-turn-helix transcriptional regulator [Oscillospiraceae bacterium]
MDDWKQTVAANLTELRKSHHMTQLQLAEMLHYSDKAVSKWERGESLPDLSVMKQLADYYGITIDDFLYTPEERAARAQKQESGQETAEPIPQIRKKNRLIIAGMAALLVWFLASTVFVVLDTVIPELNYSSFLFMYAAPIATVVCLVFNSIWFNPRWNYLIISVLVWTVLGSLFLTFYEHRIWKIFLIGIPAQLIIVLWSRLRPVQKSSKKDQT